MSKLAVAFKECKMSEEKKVKVLQSEYLFNRPWLTVRRESIVLPNGNPVPEYYVLEYPEWVNTIAIPAIGSSFSFVSTGTVWDAP